MMREDPVRPSERRAPRDHWMQASWCVNRRDAILLLGAASAGWPLVARAQQPIGVRRIGVLSDERSSLELTTFQTFAERLRALGYVEGQNIAFDRRSSQGKDEILPVRVARPGQGAGDDDPVIAGEHSGEALAVTLRQQPPQPSLPRDTSDASILPCFVPAWRG
jgi:hypothetical protein